MTQRPALSLGRSSLRLGSVSGIDVRVHFLWFLLPLVLVRFGSEPLQQMAWLVVIFGAVFLHELGHSLVAQHFGIRVLEITFWPLGGMARMSEIPENSRTEMLIAIAGPLVNFALALLSLTVIFAALLLDALWLAVPAAFFLKINLMLGGFNLIPAFPMDGGRVLRAYLGRKEDWVTATERAVRVGRYVALVMVFLAVLAGMWVVPLIAAFVWFAGAQELMAVRMRHGLGLFGRFTGTEPPPRPASAEVWPAGASAARSGAESEGAQRPGVWSTPGVPRTGGFSESDVQELERFRGRVVPPSD